MYPRTEREIYGQGWEHNVFKSKHPGWVLKQPRMATLICLRLLSQTPSELINEEIQSNSAKLSRNGILFPETKLFAFGNGYIMAQRIIEEDHSLSGVEKRDKLLQTGDAYLLDLFISNSNNFHSHQGNLYLLDLTYGFIRILNKLRLISLEKQEHIAAFLFPGHLH